MFGDQEVTLFGHYFFYTRSQGVAALVSESEANPNNNLMMRRAGLSSYKVLQPATVTKSPVNCKLPEGPAELAQFQKWCMNSPHKVEQASKHCVFKEKRNIME